MTFTGMAFGDGAARVTPHALLTIVANTQDDDTREALDGYAHDLAMILNLPVITDGVPYEEQFHELPATEEAA
jgi:hypothetical protein